MGGEKFPPLSGDTMSTVQAVRKDDKKAALRYQRDKDRESVKGIFRFYEVPGGTMMFCYKAYKEDAVENYTMVDGEVYSVPLGVARHLNKNGWYPEYEYMRGEPGVQGTGSMMKVGKKIKRFGFQSLEFVDVEDLTMTGTPQILTVETV